MSNLEKALRQTQEMLEQITALRAALGQAEPVAWIGLTSEDMDELAPYGQYARDVALLVEDRLWERNAKQPEPVALTGEAIEAALTEWFGGSRSDGSGFEGRMRAAIKAACDFKEAK